MTQPNPKMNIDENNDMEIQRILNGEYGKKKRRKPQSSQENHSTPTPTLCSGIVPLHAPPVAEVCSYVPVTEIIASPTEEPPNYDYNFLLGLIPYNEISVPTGTLSVSTGKLISKMFSRKTIIENFDSWIVSITKTKLEGFDLRQKHLSDFIKKELCCEGFLSNGTLILRGRFIQKRLESLLRKYIVAYHNCSSCKGVKVVLNKSQATRTLYNYCDVCKVTDYLPDY